jgi:ketosteroid isomerase-like protein
MPVTCAISDCQTRRRRLYDAYDALVDPDRVANGESMSLAPQDVRKLIEIYLQAWTTQDPDLILDVFTPTATYHERVLAEPIRDHAGIREYWRTKVVTEQANIQAELLNLYLDGTTAIAEWEARFDDVVQGCRKRMREVAILEFEGDRVASLREYWTSERVSS